MAKLRLELMSKDSWTVVFLLYQTTGNDKKDYFVVLYKSKGVITSRLCEQDGGLAIFSDGGLFSKTEIMHQR